LVVKKNCSYRRPGFDCAYDFAGEEGCEVCIYKEENMSEMQPVESSLIAAVGFDPFTQTLTVEFKRGGKYLYRGVSPEVYDDFLAAESIGEFFLSKIKPVFTDWEKLA
jgi:KTSC domain